MKVWVKVQSHIYDLGPGSQERIIVEGFDVRDHWFDGGWECELKFGKSPGRMEIFVYAGDLDNALEIAGNGADVEFDSLERATAGFDHEFHAGKPIYRIVVEKVGEAR